jgi:hypothetical protein
MEDLCKDIFLKLLDWPFLLFIGIGILVSIFKDEVSKLISRGGLSLTWGDKSFEMSELPEQSNENFAPVSDDIEDLKQRIKALEDDDKIIVQSQGDLQQEQKDAAKQKMLDGLSHGSYRWRSIERLASIGGITIKQAEDILRPLDETVFSVGKSGRTIIRLSNR